MKRAKRPSEVMADQISVWREKRRLTVEQLSKRITALGGHLGRVAITKIENGKRGISLDEALLLAAALNVPPPLLVFPLKRGEHVAVTPKSTIHADLATQWLAGVGPLATTAREAIGYAEWKDAARPLRLYERLHDAQDAAHRAHADLRRSAYVGDDSALQTARGRFADRLRAVLGVHDDMRADDLTPPKLPDEWAAELERLEGGIG
ncbi:MAG: helix-turn-helix transcriptional regulator [Actinobacteria bacterium]|nr:helix-turn-helix transcriptional regulator [Actinomycetota bacterium]